MDWRVRLDQWIEREPEWNDDEDDNDGGAMDKERLSAAIASLNASIDWHRRVARDADDEVVERDEMHAALILQEVRAAFRLLAPDVEE